MIVHFTLVDSEYQFFLYAIVYNNMTGISWWIKLHLSHRYTWEIPTSILPGVLRRNFFAPQPRNAATWTEPPKTNFMARPWTDPIMIYPDWTGPKHFIVNSKLPCFGLKRSCKYRTWNEAISNKTMLISVLDSLLLSLEMWSLWFSFNSTFSPKFSGKNIIPW